MNEPPDFPLALVRIFGANCFIVCVLSGLCLVIQCLLAAGGGPEFEKSCGPWIPGTFYTHILAGIGFTVAVIATRTDKKAK